METLTLDGLSEANVIPPSAEVQAAMDANRVEAVAGGVALTAVEQITQTDPTARFEYPAGTTGSRGVTYTAPTGDE